MKALDTTKGLFEHNIRQGPRHQVWPLSLLVLRFFPTV